NFLVNLLGGIAAYCYFPKKPTIRVQTVDISNDRQLTLF
ncbi:MAG: IS982 family transposase, partial [Candidatus Onthomorpha sp.]|nr:IS982 family transposase [Bacteroidales bacterium]MDY3977827.1 IS982 family transposase [Candidatus Onthomorpha sp.]MCI7034888.1 IS982 family transposase [Bacteroidales bacterium]MCI7406985.1 IS982 family transposase [Bacteroidales bacterium]MCI7407039.1 IS982 family transposase [Bacteroidales bacterium]